MTTETSITAVTVLDVLCGDEYSRRALLTELFRLRTYVWHRTSDTKRTVERVVEDYPHSRWPVVVINRISHSLAGAGECRRAHCAWPGDREQIMEWAAAPVIQFGNFCHWPIVVTREGVQVGCTVLSDEIFDRLQQAVNSVSAGHATELVQVQEHVIRVGSDGISVNCPNANMMTLDTFDDLVKLRDNRGS